LGLPAPAQSAPTGPADAAPVCGTPEKGHVTCFALRRLDVGGSMGLQPALTPAGYGPDDLRSAYGLPAGGGAGQTVAIVDAYDDPNAETDLAIYRAQFGLPACTSADGCFRKVDQRGGTSYPTRDYVWAQEISLDLDMVSAAAPLAHLVLVEADSNRTEDIVAAVDQAVAQGAKFVSNSYGTNFTGSDEDPSETTDLDAHYNHPGVAMVAASGDRGFGVSYPAASPYVTSAGGTSLVRDDSARGFSETAWHNAFGAPGSGCSAFEPKPLFQKDTGCDMRAVADVAAVSDPLTGVAVYNSYGVAGYGWVVYGGTSVASPIIAGVYAAAGAPAAGTYPNSYPYAHRTALNDVTSGDNGSCTPAYLCAAGPGYDGPTGLGTPAGPDAFAIGPHGTLTGTVTDSTTGAPVAGATVSAADSSTTTEAQGKYTLVVPVGTYDVTSDAYGYAGASASGVTIADGASVTSNLALDPLPRSTVSGTVTDGSGHGWPLYAKITVDGVPGGPVFTDPYTGRYHLTLPEGRTYTAHLTANYPGYQPVNLSLPLGADDVQRDVSVPIDVADCTAPGWATHYAGTRETFDTAGTPPGWTVSNANTFGGWEFDDAKFRTNRTGGTGHFAIVDSLGVDKSLDSILTSPVTDLSGVDAPALSFDTEYLPYFGPTTGDIEISVDGGNTWANVWHRDIDGLAGPAHVDIPLPAAAGAAQVVARFHYTATTATWWQLDNVLLGKRSCDRMGGGLVLGRVTDANTGAGVNGATVASVDVAADSTTSTATPGDPNVGDGFYRLFSSATGSRVFTATRRAYGRATNTIDVAAESITRKDVTLPAGRVTASPATVSKTVAWATPTTAKLTLTNTGTAPATVSLADQPGNFQVLARDGAAPQLVKTKVTPLALAAAAKQSQPAAAAPADVNPSAAPWTSITNYPVPIEGNLVDVFGGKVYSAYGWSGFADLADLYAYDPDTADWTKLARAADVREAPAGGFVSDRLYATGGWGVDGQPDPKTEAYDPDTNTWTTVADNPKPAAAAGSATLNGRLYVIGGCNRVTCGRSDVHVYTPASDSWTTAADYPEPISWPSCGALAGKLYCAGGTTLDAGVAHTYVYDPGTNAWTPRASMPADLWGSAHAAANGRLLVSGGLTQSGTAITNQGYAYDPVADAWAGLPNSNDALYRGGSACGLYRIGGLASGIGAPPVPRSEVLPGFTDCAAVADVPWLSESTNQVTIQPRGHATVTLTLDPSVASVTQPGTYTASLVLTSGTPYPTPPVDVTMTVKPPATWGKIAGTVTGIDGKVIGGATVQIETRANSYTLKTDKNGQYALWLDVRNNPLQVIAARDGYQPQAKTVKITKGRTTTLDFTLKPVP
jgi:N-acetylneuraminic acid mutarotase